jgi:hypothetical protein
MSYGAIPTRYEAILELEASQKSKLTKTNCSVIRSHRSTSNQVNLFFEPFIAFSVQIWSLLLKIYVTPLKSMRDTKEASGLAVVGPVHQLSLYY